MVRKVFERYDRYNPITLLHGDAAGLDHVAARLGTRLGWEVIAFPPDKNQPSPQRYHARNNAMLDWLPDVVLAFRRLDVECRGTDSVIREATRRNLTVEITEYDPRDARDYLSPHYKDDVVPKFR